MQHTWAGATVRIQKCLHSVCTAGTHPIKLRRSTTKSIWNAANITTSYQLHVAGVACCYGLPQGGLSI